MDIPSIPELLSRIEAFCLRHDMTESRFGRDALNNSAFVSGLRDKGRSPTLDTLQRVADFMASKDAEAEGAASSNRSGDAALPAPASLAARDAA